jgi:hypothetical protein
MLQPEVIENICIKNNERRLRKELVRNFDFRDRHETNLKRGPKKDTAKEIAMLADVDEKVSIRAFAAKHKVHLGTKKRLLKLKSKISS